MSWSGDKEQLSWADAIGWNFLKKERKKVSYDFKNCQKYPAISWNFLKKERKKVSYDFKNGQKYP